MQGTPDHEDLGHVVERYRYDPYGRVTVLDGEDGIDPDTTAGEPDEEWSTDPNNASDYENEILFCGYRYDPETALYHVRHRMYHPTLGRWLQRDPLGYVDGMSLYEYCGGCPLNRLDTYGLCKEVGVRQGQPSDVPHVPPGYDPKTWTWEPNENYDPTNPKQRPGQYVDPEGEKWSWDDNKEQQHEKPHWDKTPRKGEKQRVDEYGDPVTMDVPVTVPVPVPPPWLPVPVPPQWYQKAGEAAAEAAKDAVEWVAEHPEEIAIIVGAVGVIILAPELFPIVLPATAKAVGG